MEIRDVIHGSIQLDAPELPIIDSRYFQRLRNIRQLGFGEYSFPGATHNRYIHSLGAMHTATQVFQSVFRSKDTDPKLDRLRACLRLAALLHDVGHGPLSHTTEFAMPDLKALKLSGMVPQKARQATHEDYTLKTILDSGLTPLIDRAGAAHGFNSRHVASLIEPDLEIRDDFFEERVEGQVVDFRPLLKQMISSELDCDRMDYLRRDSHGAGVSYGHFDFDWIAANLGYHVLDSGSRDNSSKRARAYLRLEHRALYSFEDFLISRFHMFLMVYFHYKSVVFDSMLGKYFESSDGDYVLPADIERYAECDDAHLLSHLTRSSNPWARRITERRPYRMLVEVHSGIPATQTAAREQERLLAKLRKELSENDVDYLEGKSTGELSKYFRKPGDPIFVRYDNHYSAASVIRLEQCTDLFEKYQEKRSISRLYVSPENFAKVRRQGKGAAISLLDELQPE